MKTIAQIRLKQLWQASPSLRTMLAAAGRAMFLRSDLPTRQELSAISPARRGLLIILTALIAISIAGPVATIALTELADAVQAALSGPGDAEPAGAADHAAGAYDNILQRPLMARTRQGRVVEAAPVAVPVMPPVNTADPGFVLRGVFIDGERDKAFIVSSEDSAGSWVALNDQIAGWRLVELRPNEAVVEAQGARQALQLQIVANK